jgi:preprotein translocase subunit SecF
MKRRMIQRAAATVVILAVYPASVIIFTWSFVLRSDFEGGRNGPLDAYRHSLASALVANTLGAWAVDVTTWIFESGGRDTNRMDAHNNRIGAAIGSKARSVSDIEPAVRQAVENGRMSSSDPDQITWLPPLRWRDHKLW